MQDPSYILQTLSEAARVAVVQYEAAGPAPTRVASPRTPSGFNFEDDFGRLYIARMCAAVLHSDVATGRSAEAAAPFWTLLMLLATRCARRGCGAGQMYMPTFGFSTK